MYSLCEYLFDERIGIVSSVGKQVLCREPLLQAAPLSTIRCCTLCNNSPERHTMRIHGKMQFCVKPPMVRDMS